MIKSVQWISRLCSVGLVILGLSNGYLQATHLVGGDLGYEYLGETNPGSGLYNYRVYMNFYLNCDSSSSFETLYDLLNQNYNTPLPVGVYIEDPANPNADKVQFTTLDLLLIDSVLIEPDLPSGCGVGQGVCTKKGTFETITTLPLDFGGYHLYYQMCCRNLAITNLNNPNGTGIGYYAFIPPTIVDNSSPEFLGLPTPFLCAGDTTTFLNSAVDPDGDVLIFSFETPYNSYVVAGGITPPPATLGWPIPNVTYVGGFGVSQPFGSGGYSFINAANGLTEYVSPIQGNFIVAVEVKEYRNSILIGVTRRDLQLQAIACPPNSTPSLTTATQQVSFAVDAGDQLCFTSEFNDLDGDSLFLTASGSIFDPLVFNPAATIQAPDSGSGSVNTTFCWDTGCDQGQSTPYLFSLSVADNGCPPKTVDVVYDITVNPFIGPSSITGPNSVCEGALSSTYSTQSISGTYQWIVSGGNINGPSTDSTIVVDWGASGSGEVSVVGISAFGCSSDTISLPITISALPVANAGSDTVICVGQSVDLGGSPTGPAGASYIWSPPADLSNPVVANPVATPASTQTYVVNVTESGCSVNDTVQVIVSEPVANAGGDISICVGDSGTLNGSGGSNYSWSPTTDILGVNSPNPQVFPAATTTYFLAITDSIGCSATDSVIVSVNNLPMVDAGADTTICQGDAVSIGGQPTGPLGSGYSWSNGTSLDDASLANPQASPLVNTTYFVVVTDSNNCVNSDSVIVSLNALPAINAGPDGTICPGDSIQLNASGAGSYNWNPINSLSDPTIANPWASPLSSTAYVVSTTDANLCSNTDTVLVFVLTPVPANAGVDQSLCVGDTAFLSASGGTSYSWSPSSGLSSSNVPDPYAVITSTTTYTVTVVDSNSCVSSDDVMITINSLPSADAGADVSICENDVISIGGTPTGPAGSTYTWSPSTGLSSTTDANPDAAPAASTMYTVVVSDANTCENVDSVLVTVNPLPALDAGNDTSICMNGSVQLNAIGVGSFQWTPTTGLSDPNTADPIASPSSTTTYTVTLTDSNTCSTTDDVEVSVFSLPSIDAGPDVWLCPGFSTQLQASGGSIYTWSPIAGLSDPNLPDPVASPISTTTYLVTGVDANGCAGVDSVTVTVNDDVPVDAGTDRTICLGDSVLLGGSPTSVSGTSFNWSPATGLSDSTSANPIASPSITTTYILTVTNDTCTNVDSVLVTIAGDAISAFSIQIEPRCDGIKVYFFNQSSGTNSLMWQFSNGMVSSESDPVQVFPFGQDIVATLTVTDAFGCTSSSTQVFPVSSFQEFADISMPNVFSPNGDGVNDLFGPESNVLLGPCATMHVFNRWGQRIFTSVGGNVIWDGFTFAGQPAMNGTYFYVVELEGMEFKGTVRLTR